MLRLRPPFGVARLSPMLTCAEYAALVESPRALPGDPILVFQQPVECSHSTGLKYWSLFKEQFLGKWKPLLIRPGMIYIRLR